MNAATSTRSTTRSGAPDGATTLESGCGRGSIAARVEVMRNPRGAAAEALSTLAEIEPQLDDDDHETHYWAALAWYVVNWLGSRAEATLRSLEEAARRARMLGDRRRERGVFPFLIGAASYGPATPAEMEHLAAELDARGDTIPSGRRAAAAIRASIALLASTRTGARLLEGLARSTRAGDESGILFHSSARVEALQEARACARRSP